MHPIEPTSARSGAGGSDLRRTFATWLVQHDVPLLVAAARLGHSPGRMPEKAYGRLSQGSFDEAIAALSRLGSRDPIEQLPPCEARG